MQTNLRRQTRLEESRKKNRLVLGGLLERGWQRCDGRFNENALGEGIAERKAREARGRQGSDCRILRRSRKGAFRTVKGRPDSASLGSNSLSTDD